MTRPEPGWTLMYCQADIVNALVLGIRRARVYVPLLPLRFRYRRRYLPIRRASVVASLCVHRNTARRVRAGERARGSRDGRKTRGYVCVCVCVVFSVPYTTRSSVHTRTDRQNAPPRAKSNTRGDRC